MKYMILLHQFNWKKMVWFISLHLKNGLTSRTTTVLNSSSPCLLLKFFSLFEFSRGSVPGGALAPPDFGRSVDPISTRRDRICQPHQSLLLAPPDFQTFRRPWFRVKPIFVRIFKARKEWIFSNTLFMQITYHFQNNLNCDY